VTFDDRRLPLTVLSLLSESGQKATAVPALGLLPLVSHGRAVNVMILAKEAVVDALLHGLGVGRAEAVGCWPHKPAPGCRPEGVHTLVLLDPEQLDEADQERLYFWLEHEGRAARVVSIIVRPLFPLVVTGRFREDLYYRLNTLFLEWTDELQLVDAAPERWSGREVPA
jgi:hypothetical protein